MSFLVFIVLKRISDDDCQLLSLNPKYARSDWMILQVFPIPPPPVRPSVMMDTSSRSEDDLTHQPMIIRHNENLRPRERNGAPAHTSPSLLNYCNFILQHTLTMSFLVSQGLKELVEYGPHPPPGKTGAKYKIWEDGQRLDRRYLKKLVTTTLSLGTR
ncbi:DNA-directed RNA polymerase II subunit RPB1 [Platanthera zijinensis]|uniref:DNA-directed RNA polymerase n=1 Tax=Platanthera zijinensis TaxID=2320716 RepID=A0AAP0BLG6_9ASPA